MATPFNKGGRVNVPFKQVDRLGPIKQGHTAKPEPWVPPDKLMRDALRNHNQRQAEYDAFREWARKRPFKPLPPPSVPNVPRKVELMAQNRARQIASRIIKTGLRLHPFRMVFWWLLDWLYEWFREWLTTWLKWEGGSTGWRLFARCNTPPTDGIRGPVYWGGTQYPPGNPSIVQVRSCLSGQGVPKTSSAIKDSLDALPYPTYRNAEAFIPRGQTGTTWIKCTAVEMWGRPGPGAFLPSVWNPPGTDKGPEPNKLAPPPPWVEKNLKPDWKKEIEPDAPPPEKMEPEPEVRPEPHREIDIFPNTRTGVRLSYRYRKRTREREKEKKFAGSPQVVQAIFREIARRKEQLTEFDDFLDTFLDSLPKEVKKAVPKRNGRETPDLKAKHIYENFDKIDWDEWVENFIKNYIEDKIIGKLIDLSDRSALKRMASNTVSSRWWLHSVR